MAVSERGRNADSRMVRQRAEGFKVRPVFSISMAVINPERVGLEQAVRSILDQTYERWELCLWDSAPSERWAHEYLAGLAQDGFTNSGGLSGRHDRGGGTESGLRVSHGGVLRFPLPGGFSVPRGA